MRLLLGAGRRRRDPLLRDGGRRRRRQIRHDARRPGGLVRAGQGSGAGAGAASAAAGFHRRASAALRLLQQRDAGQGIRAAGAESAAHGGADQAAHERPFVPLRNLSAGHEGDQARLPRHGRRNAMSNRSAAAGFSRRDLLKGGGALIVGFSIAGMPAVRAAVDPDLIDSWIAVHADNTATIIFGKCELGQGNTTGMLQIAGEELDLGMSQLSAVRLDTDVTPNQGATTSSSSIERGGPQLRAAAAEARQVLLWLAAARLNAPVADL